MRIVQIILLAAALISVRPLQDWAFGSPSAQAQRTSISRLFLPWMNSIRRWRRPKAKPVMLDFYADWCVACKEFEKYTFSDPRVQQALGDTAALAG